MIYVGLDDTDVVDSPGTNQLARQMVRQLADECHAHLIVRHQLLDDPRVPYTSKNGCASLLLEARTTMSLERLASRLRQMVLDGCPEGSDPGLCLASSVPRQIVAWGKRCQSELVTQSEARQLAGEFGIYLEGLGGTEGGVIGALAAVGLLAARDGGRVVHLGSSADDFYDVTGWQSVVSLRRRGIDDVRCLESRQSIAAGDVDVGKRLRPNVHDGKVVLFVEAALQPNTLRWRALRLT
jgi:hypothetical protein